MFTYRFTYESKCARCLAKGLVEASRRCSRIKKIRVFASWPKGMKSFSQRNFGTHEYGAKQGKALGTNPGLANQSKPNGC